MVDTYQIATIGQNATNTLTFSTNGIVVEIIIQDDEQIIPGGYSDPPQGGPQEDQTEKTKTVVVRVTIGDRTYTKTKTVTTGKKITVQDVNVEVIQSQDKPTIKIKVDNL